MPRKQRLAMIGFAAQLLLLLTVGGRTLAQADGAAITVCPVNTQKFILRSGEVGVTVAATSEDATNNPATGFVDPNTPDWCTAEGEGTPERRNHIDLTFSETVVIEFIESTGLLESWVSNFSIQYSTSTSGDDFMPYGVLETSQSFIVEDILLSPGYFSLEQPIVARRLRMVINRGTADNFDRLCWGVEIFGCLYSSARQIRGSSQGTLSAPYVSTTSPVSTNPSQSPPTDPAGCNPSTVSQPAVSERQQEILIIVLPIALAAIVLILLIAIISIMICVCVTRRSIREKPSKDRSSNDPTLHYDSPRPVAYDVPRSSVRSRGGSFSSSNDTLLAPVNDEIKNPMYITKQGCLPVAPHPFSSLSNQVESSTTNDYEMISDTTSTMDNRLYEMQRSNSQMSASTKPELPCARAVLPPVTTHYATIPGGQLPTTTTSVIELPPQTNVGGEDSNTATSTKSHGYAKVHKPSNGHINIGTERSSVTDYNQTTL